MGYIHTVNITDDQSYLIEPILYGVASGTSLAIATTITNFELVHGVTISLKMTTNNAANATLSINNGVAKYIYYNNEMLTEDILKANIVYNLVYDGNVWHVIGEKPSTSVSSAEKWTTARTLTIGSTGKSVDGSENVSWTLAEIGAAAVEHGIHVPDPETSNNGKVLKAGSTAGSVSWGTLNASDVGALASETVVTNVAISADTTTSKNYALVFGTTPSDGTQPTVAKIEGLQKNSTKFYVNPNTGNLQATTFNGYILAAASEKAFVTSIDTSANLPTSNAVKTFVENKGYVTSSEVGVTSIATGAGLTGGTISTTGTIKANLINENMLTNAAADDTEVADRVYPVRLDKNGKLAVNVPWTNINSGYQSTLTFDGTYNASSNKAATVSTVTNAIEGLDVTNITGFSSTKTLETLSETDGKISATFQDINFPVISVATLTGEISASNLISQLGLSSAMHYRGTSASIPPESGTYASGDVLVKTSTDEEYVYDGTNWRLLGAESSYKVVQDSVVDPTASTATSTTFIDTISQNINGVITATKKTLPEASSSVAGITTVGAAGGAAAFNHGTHVTTSSVQTALGANASSGSTTQWLNKKGEWNTPIKTSNFTISTTANPPSSASISDSTLTNNCSVIQIVVNSGIADLQSAISWNHASNSTTITLSATVSGDVTGYICYMI